MLWPKKNSYKEFDNEKKFLRLPLLLQKSIQPFLKEISKILIEVVFLTLSLSKTGLITVLMIPFAPRHCGLSLLRN